MRFCGNDKADDPDFNAHAKMVGGIIRQVAPELTVFISTTAEGEDDHKIRAFADGEGDVLIVKQRASLGLDIARLKVALDLSPMRSRAALHQRWMRVATPYKGFWGVIIVPNEPISKGFSETIIRLEGGEATVSDMEKVETYEVPRKDQPKEFYSVVETDEADFGDSDQNWADKRTMATVEAFRILFPECVGLVSHAQLAARIEESEMQLKLPTVEAALGVDTQTEVFRVRSRFQNRVHEITRRDRKRRRLERDSPEDYGITIRQWFRRAYQIAGVPYAPLEKQSSLTKLRALDEAAKKILANLDEEGIDGV